MLGNTPESIPVKQCTVCKEWKPATINYFSRRSSQKDGLNYSCKECNRKNALQWAEENRERKRQKDREYYRSSQERHKENSRRWRKLNPERKRENDQKWRDINREKERRRHQEYARLNPEAIRASSRKKYLIHKERITQYNRQWRVSNRDKAAFYSRKYRATNPDKVRANTMLRRTRKLNAPGHHTEKDIGHQYKSQKGRCYYCKCKVGKTYHVDHVVPLSRGGSNGPENIVIACPTCNQQKSAKMPHEWPQGNRLL